MGVERTTRTEYTHIIILKYDIFKNSFRIRPPSIYRPGRPDVAQMDGLGASEIQSFWAKGARPRVDIEKFTATNFHLPDRAPGRHLVTFCRSRACLLSGPLPFRTRPGETSVWLLRGSLAEGQAVGKRGHARAANGAVRRAALRAGGREGGGDQEVLAQAGEGLHCAAREGRRLIRRGDLAPDEIAV